MLSHFRRFSPYAVRLVTVFVLYLAAGKLGLAAPFTSGNVSPFWPASGIALASILLWGYRVWPAIAAAAFLVNFWSPIPTQAALGIAAGNTSAALVGVFLAIKIWHELPAATRKYIVEVEQKPVPELAFD